MLVTLVALAAVEAARSKLTIGLLGADLSTTADYFAPRDPFYVIFFNTKPLLYERKKCFETSQELLLLLSPRKSVKQPKICHSTAAADPLIVKLHLF